MEENKKQMSEYKDKRNAKKGFNVYWNKGFDEGVEFALQQVKINCDKSNVMICTCGTEEYAEPEKRKDGYTYCSKCNNKF